VEKGPDLVYKKEKEMRILFLTLMMNFLSNSAFGADDLIAFIKASACGDRTLVSSLLEERRVDVNSSTQLGTTALIAAAFSNQPEMVRLLLGAGAEVNQVDSDNDTALRIAVMAGNIEVVRVLLTSSKKINDKEEALRLTYWLGPCVVDRHVCVCIRNLLSGAVS
jgi:ankyrin repeat protein